VRNYRLAIFVSLACLAVLALSETGMSIVWDEGYTLGRLERVRLWFKALANPANFSATWAPPTLELVQAQGLPAPSANQVASRWSLLANPRVIGWFWPFAREEPHGHPPFYALVGLFGDILTPWREPLPRARLGTMLFHALACGAIVHALKKRFGPTPALLAAATWALSPQVFGLAHYATYDGLLNSLWVLGLLLITEAVEAAQPRHARRCYALTGLVLGAAMATKLSGWFLVGPIGFAALISGSPRRQIKGLLLCLTVAVCSLYLFNPSWWCEPVGGPVRFFKSNLTRGRSIPIETLYMGKVYRTPTESLPVTNTLAWSVMATPAVALVCSVFGIASAITAGPNRRFTQIIVAGWLIPLALRALPHTPGHDGTRQFIAGLGTACLMTGIGLAWLGSRKPQLARLVACLTVVELAGSLAVYYPVPLSYFSPLVGGVNGAARLGMEPTYYWDSLTPAALDWLNANTLPTERVAFKGFPTSFFYLNQVGKLKPSVDPRSTGRFRWLVMQNRPGNFEERDRQVVRKLKPAYTYQKLGVWLVAVYDMDEVQAVWNETLSQPLRKP